MDERTRNSLWRLMTASADFIVYGIIVIILLILHSLLF